MILPKLHLAETAEAFETAAAEHLFSATAALLARGGTPVFVGLSGGATPLPVYALYAQRLAQLPAAQLAQLNFVLIDERYVGAEHADANQRSVRRAISPALTAAGFDFESHFLHFDTSMGVSDCVATFRAEMQSRNAALDLVVLGMGSDGHTASWFPDLSAEQQRVALGHEVACAVEQSQFAVRQRLTLTLTEIARASTKVLLLGSQQKLTTFEELVNAYFEKAPRALANPLMLALQTNESDTTVFARAQDASASPAGVNDHVVLLGASGNLVKVKIMNALFALFLKNKFTTGLRIHLYARSVIDTASFTPLLFDSFKSLVSGLAPTPPPTASEALAQLTGSSAHTAAKEPPLKASAVYDFLALLRTYRCNSYADADAAKRLCTHIERSSATGKPARLLLYLALPPSQFAAAIHVFRENCWFERGGSWTRVIVEKPIGESGASAERLLADIGSLVNPHSLFLIDHYLGKPAVQSLLHFRRENPFFQRIWSAEFIDRISLKLNENLSCEGRVGFYDSCGVVRDVVQNHALQILALLLCELPESLSDKTLIGAKAALLDAVAPLRACNTVLGQYVSDGTVLSYAEDGVAPGTKCPTYIFTQLEVLNARWRGVPIFLEAGKGIAQAEVSIELRLRPAGGAAADANYLRINMQPRQSYELVLNAAHVTLRAGAAQSSMAFRLDAEKPRAIADAFLSPYERLIADCYDGVASSFISKRELLSQWRIVDPLLAETQSVDPEKYVFNSSLPERARRAQQAAGLCTRPPDERSTARPAAS